VSRLMSHESAWNARSVELRKRQPRDPCLEADAGRIEQDQAGQQPHDQMAIVGRFPVDLACLRSQQVRQQVAGVCNPAPPRPRPDQAGCREGRGQTAQRVARLAGLVDEDHRDRRASATRAAVTRARAPWCRTGSRAPRRGPVCAAGRRCSPIRHDCGPRDGCRWGGVIRPGHGCCSRRATSRARQMPGRYSGIERCSWLKGPSG